MTGLVRGWVESAFPNQGLVVRGPESPGMGSARLQFRTWEYAGTGYDPYLAIAYAGSAASEDGLVTWD